MGPKSPNDAVGQLINALNSGNLDAAVSLYEPSAVLVAQPGKVARGTTALREALSAFIALKPALVSRREPGIPGGGGGPYTHARGAPGAVTARATGATHARHSS